MGRQNNRRKYPRHDQELINRLPVRESSETILIVCEGLTEVNYFRGLKNHYRFSGIHPILSEDGPAPISVVNCAIRKYEENKDFDIVACVFDYDEHESFQRAINKISKRENFITVTSRPCFEIWPLLHFNYTTQAFLPIGNKSASDHLINHLNSFFPYEKSDMRLFSKLIDRLPIAIKHAKQLEKENYQTKSTNPATNIHILIERVIRKI